MAENYTLYYFDVRGRGEPIRLIFHYANVPFNDVRIQRKDWRDKKGSFPFGQIPVLEINGEVKIAQSYAIARFLAKKLGLAGKDDLESAHLDSVADLYKDFIAESAPYLHRKPTADKDNLRSTLFEPALKRFFPLFENLLKQSNSGFFASKASWVDFFFAEGILSLKNVEPDCLKDHPILVEFEKRVHNLPQIKEYVSKRAHSDF